MDRIWDWVIFGSTARAVGSKVPSGRRKSLVRRMSPVLWMISPSRMKIPQQADKSVGGGFLKEPLECTPTEEMFSRTLDMTDISSSNRMSQEQRIEQLEHSLSALQEVVHQMQCKIQVLESTITQRPIGSPTLLIPPPPPPPPPPPMTQLIPAPPKLIVNNKNSKPNRDQARLSMGEVLKDLNKVKLRPLNRSPGGHPIKPARPATSPSNGLIAVLKKRFNAMHIQPEDKENSDPCSDGSANSSFTLVGE